MKNLILIMLLTIELISCSKPSQITPVKQSISSNNYTSLILGTWVNSSNGVYVIYKSNGVMYDSTFHGVTSSLPYGVSGNVVIKGGLIDSTITLTSTQYTFKEQGYIYNLTK